VTIGPPHQIHSGDWAHGQIDGRHIEHSYAALDAVKDEVLAPTKPQSLEEAGISADTIYALLVKWLNAGETSGLGAGGPHPSAVRHPGTVD